MILFKASIILLLITICSSELPSTNYGAPFNNNYGNGGNYGGNYGGNAHHGHDGQDPEHPEPKSYEFGYAVKDDYSGNDYKRRESSDGNQVNGEYRVQLPDGRTQIVTYYADWQTGFHADVRYEGTASYPDQYQNNNYPNNQYGPPNFNNNYPGSSSVNIKDFSGPATPYNSNNGFNYGGSNQFGHNSFDTYANNNFGNRNRPTNAYGPP